MLQRELPVRQELQVRRCQERQERTANGSSDPHHYVVRLGSLPRELSMKRARGQKRSRYIRSEILIAALQPRRIRPERTG